MTFFTLKIARRRRRKKFWTLFSDPRKSTDFTIQGHSEIKGPPTGFSHPNNTGADCYYIMGGYFAREIADLLLLRSQTKEGVYRDQPITVQIPTEDNLSVRAKKAWAVDSAIDILKAASFP